jgi:hypothetical protein
VYLLTWHGAGPTCQDGCVLPRLLRGLVSGKPPVISFASPDQPSSTTTSPSLKLVSLTTPDHSEDNRRRRGNGESRSGDRGSTATPSPGLC